MRCVSARAVISTGVPDYPNRVRQGTRGRWFSTDSNCEAAHKVTGVPDYPNLVRRGPCTRGTTRQEDIESSWGAKSPTFGAPDACANGSFDLFYDLF